MSEVIKQIGLRLRGLRESLDLTKEAFAASCDISIQDYIDYENGEKDMTISVMIERQRCLKLQLNLAWPIYRFILAATADKNSTWCSVVK